MGVGQLNYIIQLNYIHSLYFLLKKTQTMTVQMKFLFLTCPAVDIIIIITSSN